jgi:hypothetical protein
MIECAGSQPRTDERCAPAGAGSRCKFAVLRRYCRVAVPIPMRDKKKPPDVPRQGAELKDLNADMLRSRSGCVNGAKEAPGHKRQARPG